jgi:hypothetical protein
MQGSYNELVDSNQDFVEMMDTLEMNHHEAQENAKRASEMSIKRVSEISCPRKSSVLIRRISRLSSTSSVVRQFLLILI